MVRLFLVREPIAAEVLTFTGSYGQSYDGYVVAVKNTFTDLSGSEKVENVNWEIEYVKPSGVVDEMLGFIPTALRVKRSSCTGS